MSKERINLGKSGESLAVDYLRKTGYRIIVRNFRRTAGEIDIIARDHDTYVFIEVKTRRSCRFGHPAEAVTRQKQKQISRAALEYLHTQELVDVPARFDVITVLTTANEPEINHIVSAFEYTEGR
jgi:putative endonuclease